MTCEAYKRLSVQRRAFVDAYGGPANGNGAEAARIAGYSGNERTLASTASRLLTIDDIQEALADVAKGNPAIADKEEAQAFWTSVFRGEEMNTVIDAETGIPIDRPPDMKDRLKASEMLVKSQGGFLDRMKHEGGLTITKKAEDLSDDELAAICAK